MKKNILIVFTLSLFISCNENKSFRKNEIHKIIFATGGCFGECPIQAIEIDSNFNVKYHGVEYTNRIGFYTGKTTRSFWDTLNIKFENISYKQLDSSYFGSVDDLSTEIYIYYDNNIKYICGQSSSLPDTVMSTYNWIINSIDKIDLIKSKDSLTFPTFVEKPLPPPQKPPN